MKFTRIVYSLAAAYGIVFLLPLYWMIERVGKDAPPVVTHPEFYYGFIGVALLWQIVFILIAKDPVRYRPLMPIAIAEKLVYTIPVLLLYSEGQAHRNILQTSLVDPLFGLLFIIAYWRSADSQTHRAVVTNAEIQR